MKRISAIIQRLSKAEIAFYLMPVLILLLLAGTIAQKYMGLYAAHKMFFASFIFWWGPVPLPGGYLILALITASLFLKFIFYSSWRKEKAGIHISHLGVLVLLAGGLITAINAQESFMVIPEGEETPYIYDYTAREFVIAQDDNVRRIPLEELKDTPLNLPFKVEILDVCKNCEILERKDIQQDFGGYLFHDMAQVMALRSKPLSLDPQENLSGLTLLIQGAGKKDGVYIAFESMPQPILIEYDGQFYDFILGKAQRELPFSLELENFEKKVYPGTDQAEDYISEIVIYDGDVKWPARIAMNEPLRYKGYTFFQSSFEQSDTGEITILSVVQNRGWLFPYMGTILIMAGLLLHLLIISKAGRQS